MAMRLILSTKAHNLFFHMTTKMGIFLVTAANQLEEIR